MLEGLKDAAQRVADERALRALMLDCKRLLSERGEANSVAIARGLAVRFATLPDALQTRFFERLAHDFSPDPQAVLARRACVRGPAERRQPDRPARSGRAAAPGVDAPDQSSRRRHRRAGAHAACAAVAAARRSRSCARWNPTCCICCRAGSTPASCNCAGSTGTRRRSCSNRSSATRRCTKSTAGTICADGCCPTGAASRSSIRSCPTSR